MSALACARGFVGNGVGLGRRLTALGSTLPPRSLQYFEQATRNTHPNFYAAGHFILHSLKRFNAKLAGFKAFNAGD